MRTIIIRGLYIAIIDRFVSKGGNTTNNLCTKQGKFGLKSAVYNQEPFQRAGYNSRVEYIKIKHDFHFSSRPLPRASWQYFLRSII